MGKEIFIHQDLIVIEGFPVPPSYNDCLMPSGGRLIKTGKARIFEGNAVRWKANHSEEVKKISSALNQWTEESMISVTVVIAWPYDSVFTKTKDALHKIKSLDISNRIKPLHDRLVDCFGVDDMYFFDDYCEKCFLDKDSKQKEPTMMVIFKKTSPRSFDTYKATIDKLKYLLSDCN